MNFLYNEKLILLNMDCLVINKYKNATIDAIIDCIIFKKMKYRNLSDLDPPYGVVDTLSCNTPHVKKHAYIPITLNVTLTNVIMDLVFKRGFTFCSVVAVF